MRYASLLPPLILALTVAACARQQPAYYVTDSRTGQRIATGQQTASDNQRGLLGAGKTQESGYNSYASATPQQQQSSGRGLFNSDVFDSSDFQSNWFSRQASAPTYPAQPQPAQTYGTQSYGSQTYGAQTYRTQASGARTYAPQTYSYQPPQQQAYAQQQAAQPYRPPQQPYYRQPQAQPTGYYAPQYRLY